MTRAGSTYPRAARAFALPMVLLLVLISGIILAVMLDRQSMQALTVQRQLDSYRFHHMSRGIQEAVEAWIRSNGANDISDALDQDGRAFDLAVEGGQVVHIYFYEAQGSILADFAGLSGDNLDTARAIVERLRDLTGRNAAKFVRRDGPVAVSVNSAPKEVLQAVISSVLDAQQTTALLSEIKGARDGGEMIDAQGLTGLYDKANISADDRPKVQPLLTAQPVMWQVVAEADPPTGVYPPRPAVRYGGLAVIVGPGAAKDKGSLQRNSSFVSWEDLSDR